MTQGKILDVLKDLGVLLEGHFLLTSGRHSGRYVQCAKLFQNNFYSEMLCSVLADKIADVQVDTVIGPALGAMLFSYEMGRQLKKENIFAERQHGLMTLRRGFSVAGKNVLIVEDVVTTGGTVREIVDLVKQNMGNVVAIGSIVDRTGGQVSFGALHHSVISLEFESYHPDNCPLCAKNVSIYKPGSRT